MLFFYEVFKGQDRLKEEALENELMFKGNYSKVKVMIEKALSPMSEEKERKIR